MRFQKNLQYFKRREDKWEKFSNSGSHISKIKTIKHHLYKRLATTTRLDALRHIELRLRKLAEETWACRRRAAMQTESRAIFCALWAYPLPTSSRLRRNLFWDYPKGMVKKGREVLDSPSEGSHLFAHMGTGGGWTPALRAKIWTHSQTSLVGVGVTFSISFFVFIIKFVGLVFYPTSIEK